MNSLKKGWFSEINEQWPGQALSLEINESVLVKKSRFQNIVVLDSKTWGKVLVLDGVVQFTERDEFAYHEMMAHLPLFSHRCPKNVLIVGGGDGGVLREVLKHSTVQEVTVCDIDDEVVNICRKHFPNVASGWDDSRSRLVCEDAADFVKDKTNFYDVIIADTSDPVGPAAPLFEKEFYKSIHKSLKPGGIFCAQAESQWLHLDLITRLVQECSTPFASAEYASIQIPTYPCGQIGALVCRKGGDLCAEFLQSCQEPVRTCTFLNELKYYSPEIHTASFVVPAFVKRQIDEREGH